MNNITTFSFPSLTDDDGDGASLVSLTLGTASSFITVSYPNLRINPSSLASVGTYSVTISVTDDNPYPKSAKYTLKINVLACNNSSSSNTFGLNLGGKGSF